jgi:hypothetical protein
MERCPEIIYYFGQPGEKTFFESFGHRHGSFLLASALTKKRGIAPLLFNPYHFYRFRGLLFYKSLCFQQFGGQDGAASRTPDSIMVQTHKAVVKDVTFT